MTPEQHLALMIGNLVMEKASMMARLEQLSVPTAPVAPAPVAQASQAEPLGDNLHS